MYACMHACFPVCMRQHTHTCSAWGGEGGGSVLTETIENGSLRKTPIRLLLFIWEFPKIGDSNIVP